MRASAMFIETSSFLRKSMKRSRNSMRVVTGIITNPFRVPRAFASAVRAFREARFPVQLPGLQDHQCSEGGLLPLVRDLGFAAEQVRESCFLLSRVSRKLNNQFPSWELLKPVQR